MRNSTTINTNSLILFFAQNNIKLIGASLKVTSEVSTLEQIPPPYTAENNSPNIIGNGDSTLQDIH
jgi:hypothetical protein